MDNKLNSYNDNNINNIQKINDEQMISLINSLNSEIRNHYKFLKHFILEGKDKFKDNNLVEEIFMNIENNLNNFIFNAKQIFKQMKILRENNNILEEEIKNKFYKTSKTNFFKIDMNTINNNTNSNLNSFRVNKLNINYNSKNNSNKKILNSKNKNNIISIKTNNFYDLSNREINDINYFNTENNLKNGGKDLLNIRTSNNNSRISYSQTKNIYDNINSIKILIKEINKYKRNRIENNESSKIIENANKELIQILNELIENNNNISINNEYNIKSRSINNSRIYSQNKPKIRDKINISLNKMIKNNSNKILKENIINRTIENENNIRIQRPYETIDMNNNLYSNNNNDTINVRKNKMEVKAQEMIINKLKEEINIKNEFIEKQNLEIFDLKNRIKLLIKHNKENKANNQLHTHTPHLSSNNSFSKSKTNKILNNNNNDNNNKDILLNQYKIKLEEQENFYEKLLNKNLDMYNLKYKELEKLNKFLNEENKLLRKYSKKNNYNMNKRQKDDGIIIFIKSKEISFMILSNKKNQMKIIINDLNRNLKEKNTLIETLNNDIISKNIKISKLMNNNIKINNINNKESNNIKEQNNIKIINELKNENNKYKEKINKLIFDNNKNNIEIIRLKDEINKYEEQINNNNKYYKNDLIKELNEIKMKYSILLNDYNKIKKDKKINNKYSPLIYEILIDKSFNNLKWYLISLKQKNNNNEDLNRNYSNTFWINEFEIKDSLIKFNKFKTEEEIINDKLEEKDKTISLLKEKIKKIENNSESIILNNNLYENNNDFVPLSQYKKLISELNETNYKLNRANEILTKIKNRGGDIIEENSQENNFSNVNINKINKEINDNNKEYLDEEIKDLLLLENGNNTKDNINKYDGKDKINISKESDKSYEDLENRLLQIKTLIQILIHEMNYNNKLYKTLYNILLLVGFTEQESNSILKEKQKKVSMFGLFQKK